MIYFCLSMYMDRNWKGMQENDNNSLESEN